MGRLRYIHGSCAIQCVNELTPKWSTKLAGYDVFVWDQCYAIEESLLLDGPDKTSLSQFNANNAYDVYGTAIETFRTFETRNLFIPLDDYIASHASYSDFDPALFQVRVIQGQDLLHPDWVEQYHGESYL